MAEQTLSTTLSNEPTNVEKIRGLRWSYAEMAANTVFVQFTYFGSVFILFLNELQLNPSQIGLLLSFFPFFGLVALFIAPRVAKFGYKRTWLTFWTIRKFITALLLLVPWVLSEFGSQVTLLFVGAIVIGFGLCRAIAEVGYYPWSQEFVPESMRGRYSATANIFGNVAGVISVVIASAVIERGTGLDPFMLLFAVGVGFGLLGVWFMTFVPGGASTKQSGTKAMAYRDMLTTFKDRNFWYFVIGLGLVVLGTTPMFSFLPLFMKQEVGLSEGNVVLLTNGTLIGALVATFLVGWSAGRYGSKPVMVSGIFLMMLLPAAWLFIPQNSTLSLPYALTVAVLQGVATLTWTIGFGRMLHVRVVPPAQRAPYMAVYYASIGLIGGISQLMGGTILDFTQDISGQIGSYDLNPFTPMFVLGILLLGGGYMLLRKVRDEKAVTTRQFAGMFMRGNPVLAFESMFGYYRARDERATVAMTERLGQSHSPLTTEELLEALIDPRFNVRFEALVSIARTRPDPRLGEALAGILHGTELSLSVMAAWALGRIGDQSARQALRDGLDSEYRSIRAHCARALGTLRDEDIAPILMERLQTHEADKGLTMAYASALGSMGYEEAVPLLLETLKEFENEGARMELALSLARIIDEEPYFIRTLRNMRRDAGTTVAQVLTTMKRKLKNTELNTLIDTAIDAFAHDNMDGGTQAVVPLLRGLPDATFTDTRQHILTHSIAQLEAHHYAHPEYLLLALVIVHEPDSEA